MKFSIRLHFIILIIFICTFGYISNVNGFSSTASVVKTNTEIVNKGKGSPVLLIIPKLNIVAGFQYNGLKSDGTMEIPSNIFDVGWFTGSSYPGETGTAVITGHVAQIRGGVMTNPGVFYNLNELQVDDLLLVINDRGELNIFIVRESRLYDPMVDATSIFVSTDNGTHLNLITCEGTWNPFKQSYSQRLVIFTDAYSM